MISVVQCRKCGWIQASTGTKSFNCRRCNYSTSISKIRIIKVVKDSAEARALIMVLRSNQA